MTIKSKNPTSHYNTQNTTNSNDGCALPLLYIATFFIPLVGLIVGGIYSLNDDPEKSSAGKGLLIFGIVMIFIGILVGAILLN